MKTCIFLTARVGSTRLTNKTIMQINGETVTDILIQRLKHANIPIIMCTTNEQDDRQFLKPIADNHGIGYHEAPAGNIIAQHLDCCVVNNVDYVILSEGDDFLCCPEVINAVYFQAEKLKFKRAVRTEGLPFGLNVIAYPRENLESTTFSGNTGWGVHVTQDAYKLKFNYERNYRLSMDYLSDFEVMENVYLNCKRNLYVGGIVKYLDKHPEIANLNLHLDKKYWERMEELSQ